ncbi:MAG: hypothetical protein RMK16_03205 [Acidobacteriota bacterium]|nr:hypothetical protein [Acidobacteriota bacterium]
MQEAPLSKVYFYLLPLMVLWGVVHPFIRSLLIFSVIYYVFWFLSGQILRYLVPILPALSLVAAGALQRTMASIPWARRWTEHPNLQVLGVIVWMAQGWLYAWHQVHRQGWPPATPAQRDAYLASRLPAYPAYQLLNKTKGTHYTIYALYDSNMAYFADGTFIGDWFGPGRFSRILDKLSDPAALSRELRSLGAQYFLVNRSTAFLPLPPIEALSRHGLRLIYARSGVWLFELRDRPMDLRTSGEYLTNPDFEALDPLGRPAGWTIAGQPVIDASGRWSRSGRVAVYSSGVEHVLYQTRPARPGTFYRFRLHARSLQAGQQARLQLNWLDAAWKLLSLELQVVPVDTHWNAYEMIAQVPRGAAYVTIHVVAHERSHVWFDDVSLTEIAYPTGPIR